MQMSLALIGLLLAIGAANCEKDFDAVVLNSNLFGSATGDAAPGSPFWWMSKGSPFKRAVANGPPSQQFDASSNPFLNRGSAKLYSAPGYLPPDEPKPQPTKPPTIPCTGNGRACVPKYQCSNGFIDANQFRGSNSQQCNPESEVCCTIRQPPPPPPPPRPQPTQPRPQPTAAPTTTRNSYIPPPAPTRSQPQPTPCAGSSVCVQQYQCQGGSIPRSNPAASRGPASSCLQPEVCCRIQEEPRPKPTVNVITYQPSPSTQRPYVTQAVQTPRPIITKKPFVGQQYIPPRDNEVPEGNNPIGQYLPPNQGEDEKSELIPNQSNDSPASFRPPGGQNDLPEQLPPVQCPAATNCTAPEYCAADGSISKTPVILSPEQEAYRVPLSDCRDLSKGITGKCCRDLDYTDPWPTDLLRTGAFDANVLAQAFDDGQYRPNGNNGQRKRGEEKKSPNIFIPQQSQTTKSYTNAPFNPNAISSNNKPSVPQPSTPLNPFNNQPQVPFSSSSSPSSPQPFFNAPSRTSQNFIPQTVVKPTKSAFVQKPFSQQAQRFVQSPQPSFATPLFTRQPNGPSESQFIQPEQPSFGPNPSSNQQFVQPQQESFATPSAPEFNQPQQPEFSPQSPGTASSRSPFSPFQASFKSNQPGQCAVRDSQGLPRGYLPNEAAFGEFPWQAMVLRESTKSILCGGAIIEKNVVATAASCVDGLRTHDVIVKAGEWKLGSNEEPKPFQTVRVKQITMHPAYQPTNLESDLALLHLENDLKYDQHIGAICLDESELDLAGSNEECVTSGWGKEIIKYHVSGSLPHSLAINPLSESECQTSLNSYNPNSAVCGRAQGDPCDVDTGSALACTRGNGRYLLKGIYSTNSGCGSNQVMSFTKMDVDFLRGAGGAIKSLPINHSNANGISGFGQRLQSAPNQPAQISSFSSPSSTSQAHGYLPPQP